MPYAFGQLPSNMNPNDPKSQHPIPGSYNRNHAFNPKTQSFVPGGNNMPSVAPPQPPFTAPGSIHSSPRIGAHHVAYPGYQQPVPPYGGYGMVRQGSSTSMSSYHSSSHIQHHMQQSMQVHNHPNHHMPPQPSHPSQQPPLFQTLPRANVPSGPIQNYPNLPAYGNPVSLPQKPSA